MLPLWNLGRPLKLSEKTYYDPLKPNKGKHKMSQGTTEELCTKNLVYSMSHDDRIPPALRCYGSWLRVWEHTEEPPKALHHEGLLAQNPRT